MERKQRDTWHPVTEQGLDNKRLLDKHAKQRRAKAEAEIKRVERALVAQGRPAPGSAESKQASKARKRQMDAERRRMYHVQLLTRDALPTDLGWAWQLENGQPLLMPTDITKTQTFFGDATPYGRISQNCKSTTLSAAFKEIRAALSRPIPLWLPVESPWLCLWAPKCGMISELKALLAVNPDLGKFPILYIPACWSGVRRRGAKDEGSIYPNHVKASEAGEPEEHYGCYALIYIEQPCLRTVLFESTVVRLYLAGHGVYELSRGVILQPSVRQILHRTLYDQPLWLPPVKAYFGGKKGTHWAFKKERAVVIDCPAGANPSSIKAVDLQLNAEEQRQYQLLQQRMVAPIDLEGDSHPCLHQ